MRILVIGDVMLDRYYWGDITRISPEVPVPVCSLRDVTVSLGGAANVAHNLANLGEDVTLIGVIGDDDAGREFRSLLGEKHVHAALLTDPSRPTTVKTRVIGNSQHIVRIDSERVKPLGAELSAELHSRATTEGGAAAVILSDYAKGMFLDAVDCRRVVQSCRDAGVPVFVDPKSNDWARYAGATCITPNKKELLEAGRAAAIASDDVADVARALIERHGFEHVLVTLGPDGMRLFSGGGGDESFTSAPREVFDVSGAGDTVVATFAASYAAGLGAGESARRANAAAGIVVGKVGTYPVSQRELDEALGLERYRTDKRCSLDEALHRVAFWRSEGNSVVFTNGCFDLLHAGHVLLFQEARKLGDKLVVAVNSDASVRRIKGAPRPVLREKERLQILSAITPVDMLLVFDDDEPTDLIAHIKPDVLAKGSDYALDEVVGGDIVRAYGGRVERIEVLENTSVSDIVERLKGAGR